MVHEQEGDPVNQGRFQVYKAADGWRWRLLAGNNKVIASGEAHTRERDARRAASKVCDTCRLIHWGKA